MIYSHEDNIKVLKYIIEEKYSRNYNKFLYKFFSHKLNIASQILKINSQF